MSELNTLFVLRKTRNGWLITEDDGWLDQSDVANSFVFETMSGVCEHLLAETKSVNHPCKSVAKKSK